MEQAFSRTAQAVARQRAAHQLLDGGVVFPDPLAVLILGEDEATITASSQDDDHRQLRRFAAARSRFAEDGAAAAVRRGTRQIVVLGAGLDTFGLRAPHAAAGVVTFEVDHPATQAFKRARIAAAALAIPASLRFIAVDFERETLADRLAAGGVDLRQPAFFVWLGVVIYLSRDAIAATLAHVAGVPGGEIAFDYGEPAEAYAGPRRTALKARMALVAAIGEPWLSFFRPAELNAELRRLGFEEIEDLGPHEIAQRYFSDRPPLGTAGSHLLRARRP